MTILEVTARLMALENGERETNFESFRAEAFLALQLMGMKKSEINATAHPETLAKGRDLLLNDRAELVRLADEGAAERISKN